MRKVKLTKISDDKFNGQHPNGINVGYVKEGQEYNFPVVGEVYWIDVSFHTSTVIEVTDQYNFKTKNSTYKIEVIQ